MCLSHSLYTCRKHIALGSASSLAQLQQHLGALHFTCATNLLLLSTCPTLPTPTAPWFTYPEATPSSAYYLETLAKRPNFGIALSGGGYRAVTTGLGYIRCVLQARQLSCLFSNLVCVVTADTVCGTGQLVKLIISPSALLKGRGLSPSQGRSGFWSDLRVVVCQI